MKENLPEFNLSKPSGLAEWLNKAGRYDTSECLGKLISKIVIDEKFGVYDGEWTFPLQGGIDVVDVVDRDFAEQDGAVDVFVDDSDPNNPTVLTARYTGTDDITRSAPVDIEGVRFTFLPPYQ